MSKAAKFMRENTFNGNRVLSGTTTDSGGLRYRMEDGTVFNLSAKDAETLGRYGFKPRYKAPEAKGGIDRSAEHELAPELRP